MSVFSIVMFLIPPVAIFTAMYVALRCVKTGKAPSKAMKFHFVTLISLTLLMVTGAMTVLAEGDATTATQAVTASASGLKYLSAALCTGVASIGGGMALAAGIPAAIGATSEDPKAFGKALIFVALGETLALYGVIISFMILNA
jgi:V/A-type H+-transporting ATPase subunit K